MPWGYVFLLIFMDFLEQNKQTIQQFTKSQKKSITPKIKEGVVDFFPSFHWKFSFMFTFLFFWGCQNIIMKLFQLALLLLLTSFFIFYFVVSILFPSMSLFRCWRVSSWLLFFSWLFLLFSLFVSMIISSATAMNCFLLARDSKFFYFFLYCFTRI